MIIAPHQCKHHHSGLAQPAIASFESLQLDFCSRYWFSVFVFGLVGHQRVIGPVGHQGAIEQLQQVPRCICHRSSRMMNLNVRAPRQSCSHALPGPPGQWLLKQTPHAQHRVEAAARRAWVDPQGTEAGQVQH